MPDPDTYRPRISQLAARRADRYAEALRHIRADLVAVAAGEPLDTRRMIDSIDRVLDAPSGVDAPHRPWSPPDRPSARRDHHRYPGPAVPEGAQSAVPDTAEETRHDQ